MNGCSIYISLNNYDNTWKNDIVPMPQEVYEKCGSNDNFIVNWVCQQLEVEKI